MLVDRCRYGIDDGTGRDVDRSIDGCIDRCIYRSIDRCIDKDKNGMGWKWKQKIFG